MIGIVIVGSVRGDDWDWKLLHRVAGKTIIEHTVAAMTEVEIAHKVIICLDYNDMTYVSGSAFTDPAIKRDFVQTDPRIKFHFSDKRGVIGKVYEACVKFGLTSVCIIEADAVMTPAWLVKDCILSHMTTLMPVRTSKYPKGIDVKVYPFHILANIYRYRDFADKRQEYTSSISYCEIINTNESTYYVYDGISYLQFRYKTNLAMLDAILTDLSSGEDLSDLLKEWHEQEKSTKKH